MLRSSCLLLASGFLFLSCARELPLPTPADLPAVDVLTAALLVEPSPLGRETLKRHMSQVDAEAAQIHGYLDPAAPPDRVLAALNQHLFGEGGFAAIQDLTSSENTSVAAVLENRQGTCLGLAIVYLALAERLGLSAHTVATPVHLFIRVQLADGPRNVELLEEGRAIPDDIDRRRNRRDGDRRVPRAPPSPTQSGNESVKPIASFERRTICAPHSLGRIGARSGAFFHQDAAGNGHVRGMFWPLQTRNQR